MFAERLPATMVAGSISPWVEAILLAIEPRLAVTTVDYNVPILRDTSGRIRTAKMEEVMNGKRKFGLIVSFSSIEHDGLGRYGDPLKPDGDLAAMKKMRDILTPEGFLLLAVPVAATDKLHIGAERMYGQLRIPKLLEGWRLRYVVGNLFALNENPNYNATSTIVEQRLELLKRHDPTWMHQPVLVLQHAANNFPPFRCIDRQDRISCGHDV
uniref:DUF268 domain-containing protein n=1 Tax=Lotharella oceanica TaxID=641309 RepID=A0A7S2TNS7_9EUKA|mmetsp:Transcript_20332/g.38270  ORF Transcript_20332/g.38270 Transcript_20332/m.38270 type:complete len:212 (+) Transcript_20332:564-1199(+)